MPRACLTPRCIGSIRLKNKCTSREQSSGDLSLTFSSNGLIWVSTYEQANMTSTRTLVTFDLLTRIPSREDFFDIAHSQFTGSVPTEIGTLTNLGMSPALCFSSCLLGYFTHAHQVPCFHFFIQIPSFVRI